MTEPFYDPSAPKDRSTFRSGRDRKKERCSRMLCRIGDIGGMRATIRRRGVYVKGFSVCVVRDSDGEDSMQTHDESYELFRRAVVERDAEAWTMLAARYRNLLIIWA